METVLYHNEMAFSAEGRSSPSSSSSDVLREIRDGQWSRSEGPFTYDVRKSFGIFNHLSPCRCHTHATYQCHHLLLDPPPAPLLRTSYVHGP